jgi:hypothetical protein
MIVPVSECGLRELGAAVSYADAFDAEAVRSAIETVAPDVVIDQLTRLPADPRRSSSRCPKTHGSDAREAPTCWPLRGRRGCAA